jgi:hypothetical protein
MANTFVLIVQQPLEFQGQSYQPGDRLVADWTESPGLKRSGLAILAPEEEQRAHGAAPRLVKRSRGRPRKAQTETAAATYQRRDLQAEE